MRTRERELEGAKQGEGPWMSRCPEPDSFAYVFCVQMRWYFLFASFQPFDWSPPSYPRFFFPPSYEPRPYSLGIAKKLARRCPFLRTQRSKQEKGGGINAECAH